jgi:release factor glutamine methyltransferase
MRGTLKKIVHPLLKFWLKVYYLRPQKYTYKNATVIVHKDVFSPYMTISTKIFIDFIETLELEQKSVLELGCGSGLISIFSAKKGAIVTASDINPTALRYLQKSAELNHVHVTIRHSDLFSELKKTTFDYLFINPPYFPKQPKNIVEKAWYCGEDFDYFKRLFMALPDQLIKTNHCYMILSDTCQLETISRLAHNENLIMQVVFTKKVVGEVNYVFEISAG